MGPVVSKSSPKKKAPKRRAKKPAEAARFLQIVSTGASRIYHHDHSDHAPALLPEFKKAASAPAREPLGHMLIEHALREGGFQGEILNDEDTLERYATDESIFHIKPQIVIRPKDLRDVKVAVASIKAATAEFPSLSLTARAAGTGLGGGSLTDSVVIDIKEHLNSIISINDRAGDLTVTVAAGAMWRDVEKELLKHKRYLPPYPASKHICTIGGAVSNNSAGPDSLRYGHVADWIESLEVVLDDGEAYTVEPMSYKEFRTLQKSQNAYAVAAKKIFNLVTENEALIEKSRPKTKKNTAGYALWDVFSTSSAEWKKGKGVFDLTRLIAGGQGTIGIVTKVTMRTCPIPAKTTLIAVPVFDLGAASKVVVEALKYQPTNIEVFDALTYDSAMKNPQFFKERLSSMDYYPVLLYLYTTFHVRWSRKLPEFVLLITLDDQYLQENSLDESEILKLIQGKGGRGARIITNKYEQEMLWQVRNGSYLLSKLLDPKKRPAAFLEDMTVPPEHMAKFFADIKYLLKKYHITAAVHGHGGNGHFHFYPLLDFTSAATPALVIKMAEEFFAAAIKYGGNICGEHNDGIIRTPHLSKMFKKEVIKLFEEVEDIFDHDDIFNPGKKVHPRFDIKASIRHTN